MTNVPALSWQLVILSFSLNKWSVLSLYSLNETLLHVEGYYPHSRGMASPKAICSFNGALMWFVLYLPVSANVPLDSDEAELFICRSCSWYRCTLTQLWAELPALTWTCSDCKVRNFWWRCLIMQSHVRTCWTWPAAAPPFISVSLTS